MLRCSIQSYGGDSLIWIKEMQTPDHGAGG